MKLSWKKRDYFRTRRLVMFDILMGVLLGLLLFCTGSTIRHNTGEALVAVEVRLDR